MRQLYRPISTTSLPVKSSDPVINAMNRAMVNSKDHQEASG